MIHDKDSLIFEVKNYFGSILCRHQDRVQCYRSPGRRDEQLSIMLVVFRSEKGNKRKKKGFWTRTWAVDPANRTWGQQICQQKHVYICAPYSRPIGQCQGTRHIQIARSDLWWCHMTRRKDARLSGTTVNATCLSGWNHVVWTWS